MQERSSGSTACARAEVSLLPSAAQNALTACSAAAAWAGDRTPDGRGGAADRLNPILTDFPRPLPRLKSCEKLATSLAGGADTRTGRPKSEKPIVSVSR